MKLGRFSISLQRWCTEEKDGQLCWKSSYEYTLCQCHILCIGPVCIEWLSKECM